MTSGGGRNGGRVRHLRPSRDPAVPHPGRVFLSGKWRTPEMVERRNAVNQRYEAKREVTLERRLKTMITTNNLRNRRDAEKLKEVQHASTEAEARFGA